ncbi:MAG: hypothetical protein IJZ95_02005 [Oscillospiraceae bacterium]|nr:hypothetical protein [Oscillospiraceae bacterium]
MLKKLTAAVISAVMAVSFVGATASAQQIQTATISSEYGASAAVKWNGKTALKAGQNYVVSSNVTVSKKITIPSGTTVTVQDGAKLWVSGKGSLYIKGKLVVKADSILAVTGKLHQYKGKVLKVYGQMRFASKASVTLNGKTTVYSKGSVTGTPNTCSVGPNATLTCSGKNSCKKLDEYIDRTAIAKRMDSYFTQSIKELDVYGGFKAIFSKAYINALEDAFSALGEMTLEDYCTAFTEEYKASLIKDGITPSKIKSVDVKLTEMAEQKKLTGDLKTLADSYYKGWSKVYDVTCEVTVKTASASRTEVAELVVICAKSGKWYLLGA